MSDTGKLALHVVEDEINDVGKRVFEDFYYIGQRLQQIRDERLYQSEGFKSWSSYCKSGRIEHSKQHADRMIRHAELRPMLADVEPVGSTWAERSLRELAKLPEKNDAKRVSKKIATHLKKNPETKLTSALVKEFVESDTGVARKRAEAVEAKLNAKHKTEQEESQLAHHIKEFLRMARDYRKAFEAVTSVEDWQDADRQSPDSAKRLADELEAIASYLRS